VRRGEPIRDWDVVDAHAHIGRWYNFFTPATDPAAMVAVMDRCGVRKAVVSGLLGVGPDAAGANVEVVELVRRYPERFAGYAVLNPHHPDSPADVERTLDLPGIVGIKIHPETHAYPVTGNGYAAAWEIANRRGVPVLTHTEGGSPYCDPAMFRAVAERWSQVRIILGHAGVTEAGHRAAIAVARDHPNLILELCGSLTTGQWIRRLVDAVGPERVLFGSDFPFIDLRYGLGRVVFAGLPPDDLRQVLGGNARRLLKI
jgi:predicted TIM-barrel fold metal-dependent hydrolase